MGAFARNKEYEKLELGSNIVKAFIRIVEKYLASIFTFSPFFAIFAINNTFTTFYTKVLTKKSWKKLLF